MARVCPSCGAEVDTVFCTVCGQRMEEQSASFPPPPPPPALDIDAARDPFPPSAESTETPSRSAGGDRNRRWWWVGAAVLLVAGVVAGIVLVTGGSGDTNAAVVCTAVDEDGDVAERLLVVTPTGEVVRSVDAGVTLVPTGPRPGLYPWALYRSFDDDELRFVDASTGDIERLGDIEPLWQIRGPSRYAVADQIDDGVLLFDFAEGTVTDLTDTLESDGGGEVFVVFVDYSDRVLLIVTTDGLWLVPPSDPGEARLLDAAVMGDLSPDGRRIAYRNDEREAFAGSVTGSSFPRLATDVRAVAVVGDETLLVREDTISLVDGGGDERTLWDGPESFFGGLWVAEDGRGALVGLVADGSELVWIHVDPAAGRSRTLDVGDLSVSGVSGRFAAFLGQDGTEERGDLRSVGAIVDLSDGSVHEIDMPDEPVLPFVLLPSSGEAGLVQSPEGSYVLDATTGELAAIPGGAFGVLSPTGDMIAWIQRTDDGRPGGELVVASSTDLGSARDLGVFCVSPAWVSIP